ncbi:MAG: nicotinate-nucleotide adenylyltransferase [Pseudomonadales bacterium]|nr:nicotinate-nucleotide adenylyltransferase [Pseudomonadales bacterium]
MNERIGIMGGMFDPVHVGHIKVALAALSLLQLDQVRLIPCGVPNHRDPALCTPKQRVDMLRLATGDCPRLIVDERELNRPGTSYSVDTLLSLRKEYPLAGLYFILGIDAFAALPAWHCWRELFELCHFVVIERPGYAGTLPPELEETCRHRQVTDVQRLHSSKHGLVLSMPGLDSPVSSTQVRASIADRKSLDGLLDSRVADYLRQHLLYLEAVTKHQHENGKAH